LSRILQKYLQLLSGGAYEVGMKTLFQLYLNILQLEVIGSLVTAVHDEGCGLVDTFVSDTHKVMTCDHVCSCCNFSGFAGTDTHFILNVLSLWSFLCNCCLLIVSFSGEIWSEFAMTSLTWIESLLGLAPLWKLIFLVNEEDGKADLRRDMVVCSLCTVHLIQGKQQPQQHQ
jgi:hypothetical protein